MRQVTFAYRCLVSALAITAIASMAGCEGELRTEYGQSRGVSGDQSINGFGVLRRRYENIGWSSREIKRLNERLANVDTVVWLPQFRDSFNDTTKQWFDQWLSEKSRTLVYIVPDDGCETRYLEAARRLAAANQQLAYRRRLARLETDQLINRLRNESIIDNGWFAVERLPEATPVDEKRSEWSWRASSPGATSSSSPPNFVEATVDYKVIASPSAQASTSPQSMNTSSLSPPAISAAAVTGAAQATVDLTHSTLLNARDGSPVVVRLTAKRWGESKIIVVSSGSLLGNFSMTGLAGQHAASHLIAESGPSPGIVGFMTTDFRGAVISEVDPEINRQTGMELLTVWPLSLIVLHLAVMGFIVCMILLPIFGRPREPAAAPASNFADHLDAVASLMIKSGGEDYARRRVSDYMRRIHGETSGPWILPEAMPQATVTAPPRATDLPLANTALTITKDTP